MNALLFKRNYLNADDILIANYSYNNFKSKDEDLNLN